MAASEPQIVGRYAIYGKIASGGMASVHFGRLIGAAGFSRTVAIKRLHSHLAEDPEFLSTMIDEARLAARIHHPNVVPTLDVVAADGELLVVMEYVRGESLARLVRAESARGRHIPLPIASAILVGALHGLHAAHEATSDRGAPLGIVHRDVSPQNILVGVDGVARVIDFGVAKAAGRLQTTREGVIKGKMPYMAPEQLSDREISRRVDVYSAAVVLWEVLTGKRLFQGEGDAAIFGKVLAGAKEPPSLHAPNLPAELDTLLMKGLAIDPADRFASAKEMADALMRCVPPAFSTDVGTWVEQAAHEGLSRRGAVLAEIESSSGMTTVQPPATSPTPGGRERAAATAPDASADEPQTTVSQPSSLSVETPPSATARGHRFRRAGLAAALVLVAAGIATVAWRAGPARPAAAAAVSVPPPPTFATPSGTSAPPAVPDVMASGSSSASPAAPLASAPAPSSSSPSSPRPARPIAPAQTPPRVTPKPTGSIRFAQPD